MPSSFPETISIPRGRALAFTTSSVCGNSPSETKNLLFPALAEARLRALKSMIMASAAAVPSSSREALASRHGREVRDHGLEIQQRFEAAL